MTDLELDRELALAIGYRPKDVLLFSDCVLVYTGKPNDKVRLMKNRYVIYNHRIFSHKDWNVIGPIAQVYNCFPYKWRDTDLWVTTDAVEPYADTPQRAIAMAVIKGVGK